MPVTRTRAHTSTSRVEQGWVRCPNCRQLFRDSHSCRASALGPVVSRRPEGFEAQVEQARAEARADAAAGQQLALDVLPAPCRDCGTGEGHIDPDSARCVSCMYRAALQAAGLTHMGGSIAPVGPEPGRAPP